jgi:hypothetical protein
MLSVTDRRILDLERSWWLLPGPKEGAISDVVGISAARYYERLRELAHVPEAGTYDPLTVRRIRRILSGGIP